MQPKRCRLRVIFNASKNCLAIQNVFAREI